MIHIIYQVMNPAEARESFAVLLREAEIRTSLGRDVEDLLPLLEQSWSALSPADRLALESSGAGVTISSLRVA